MGNVSREVIWPTDSRILVRVVFLYVGQGDSAVVLVRNGSTYRTLLCDINKDKEKTKGISVPLLMADLLKDEGGKLGVFFNTHPHNDHLDDLDELDKKVDIQEVWHSGHVPAKNHQESFDVLKRVIDSVKKKHGKDAEKELTGSTKATVYGDAEYYVLAPAQHVKDSIDDETEEKRNRRIHEQCAVLKIGKGNAWIMLTGDADRDAWEKHITNYHKDRLPANVLSAPHHGSKTFFRYDDKDDPYLDALKKIAPKYVIVSAPKQSESVHGHPHNDAMKFYADEVGEDNVLHSGKNRESYICDIYDNGTCVVNTDVKLVEEYGGKGDGDDGGKSSKSAGGVGPTIITGTQIDRRPMGESQ